MHQMHPGRQQWAGFCTIMLLGDRITGRYDLARFQRSSQILSCTRMNGRSFSFSAIAAHNARGTTEFRVSPAPTLRTVITQLRRRFLFACLSRVQTIG